MTDPSVAIAKLQADRHNHANKLQEHAGKIDELGGKVSKMGQEVAVIQSEILGLRSTVTTGFLDLKEVIVHRAEQEAEERARAHELAMTAAADKKALTMKALGLIAAAIAALGGGGSVLYSMGADTPERPPVSAPVPVSP